MTLCFVVRVVNGCRKRGMLAVAGAALVWGVHAALQLNGDVSGRDPGAKGQEMISVYNVIG